MHQDLKDFRPLDPGRVNTMDGTELEYWCATLHCTPVQLNDAVTQAGDHISAVRAWLDGSQRQH
jgi:hypothetical protein